MSPLTEQLWRAGAWRPTRRAATILTTPTTFAALDSTAAILDPIWFAHRFAEGYRLYVLHTTDWGATTPWWRTEAQLGAALASGLKVGAYTRDPQTWQAGIEACGPYIDRLQFFALDVETEGPLGDPGHQVTRAMVDGVMAMGVRPVIYTGSGMWPLVMGPGNTAFADVPLWDTDTSNPPSSPTMSQPAPVAYGGWNVPGHMRVMVQQAFDVTVEGIALDQNSVDPAFLEDL